MDIFTHDNAMIVAVWGLAFVTVIWVAEVFYNRCKRAEQQEHDKMTRRIVELGQDPKEHV